MCRICFWVVCGLLGLRGRWARWVCCLVRSTRRVWVLRGFQTLHVWVWRRWILVRSLRWRRWAGCYGLYFSCDFDFGGLGESECFFEFAVDLYFVGVGLISCGDVEGDPPFLDIDCWDAEEAEEEGKELQGSVSGHGAYVRVGFNILIQDLLSLWCLEYSQNRHQPRLDRLHQDRVVLFLLKGGVFDREWYIEQHSELVFHFELFPY